MPTSPITARTIVFESYVIIGYDDKGIEAVNTVDLLRSCQATCVACHFALGRSLRIREYQSGRQDLEVSS